MATVALHWAATEVTTDATVAWWQVATGILGVPAAVLGLVLTWQLVGKARLESSKIRLELQQLQQAQSQEKLIDESQPSISTDSFLSNNSAWPNLLPRLIVLYVVSTLWSLVQGLFNFISRTTGLGAVQILQPDPLLGDTPGVIAVVLALRVIAQIPQVGYWLIIVGFGWPLLMDAIRLLNLETPKWVASVRTQQALTTLAIIIPLAQGVLPGLTRPL